MQKRYWRLLRSFHIMMASRDYDCDFCHHTIYSGDEYDGSVFVSISHEIRVEREHLYCFPDDPDCEPDWEYGEEDDMMNVNLEEEIALPLAA